MKRSLILFLAITALLSACDKTPTEPTITRVILSVDKVGIFSNGSDAITFSAELPDKTSVTSESDFYVDGVKLAGNIFTSTTAGEYEAYVIYKTVESIKTSVGVVDKVEAPNSYSAKVLVEDYTGTWCGYCPRIAYKLEEAATNNSKIIPVGVHYGDGMQYIFVSQMTTRYGITGYPTAVLNRSVFWNETQAELDALLNTSPKLGLSVSSTVNGSTLNVNTKVGFSETLTSKLKLVVYLVEDGIIEDQDNYMNNDPNSPWYQAGNPIIGYEHNHVLRKALTDIFGDEISQYVSLERNTYSIDFSTSTSTYNTDKLYVIAFVLDEAKVYNVQIAKVGTTTDFD
jgi:thiol-disulfide isomerase/thioredoxin